jgi:polysaccharide deacetylase family protein (PEP-CTERM system associated)
MQTEAGATSCEAPAVEHGLSFDVEDYRQILSARFRGESGPVTAQFERNMEAVLALLAEAGAAATFFVTGTVAEGRPDLVRRWAEAGHDESPWQAGHEIASHGYDHTPVWRMTRAALAQELGREKARLQDAAGRPVRGYRAPIFSIRWDTLWAMDAVQQAGFDYDSSIVPVRMRRYGVEGFARAPGLYVLPSGGDLVEVPIGVGRVAGRLVPMAGGGYVRLFSRRRIERAVAAAQDAGAPFTVYAHPDEFGEATFRAVDLATGWRDRLAAGAIALKSNIGRHKVPETIRALLARFRFATLGRIAARVREKGVRTLFP